jgi:hypothetical protein
MYERSAQDNTATDIKIGSGAVFSNYANVPADYNIRRYVFEPDKRRQYRQNRIKGSTGGAALNLCYVFS